jgi:CxxC-x17-CxxC domain-containing protein
MAGDQQLMCSDCGQSFTFTTEDQAFFRERGYSAPKRCKACRRAKKNEAPAGGGGSGAGYRPARAQGGTTVTCAACGQQTTVPFEPRGDRPVFCKDCYQAQKGGAPAQRSGRGR